jgi:hypothetical protein
LSTKPCIAAAMGDGGASTGSGFLACRAATAASERRKGKRFMNGKNERISGAEVNGFDKRLLHPARQIAGLRASK